MDQIIQGDTTIAQAHADCERWPGNHVDLESARQNIKTARSDLSGARADVNHLLQLLGA